MIHTVKGFGIVNKAEIDVFLELSCFFHDTEDAGNLISGFSAFSKSSLTMWKFTVHRLLKPGLENFEHYSTSLRDECNCAVVWAFFCIAFLSNWSELNFFSSQGLFFICGTSFYMCLPLNWKEKCSLGYIIFNMNSVVRYSPILHKTILFWTRTWKVPDQWDLSSLLSSLSLEILLEQWQRVPQFIYTLNSPRPCLSCLQAWANYTPILTPC